MSAEGWPRSTPIIPKTSQIFLVIKFLQNERCLVTDIDWKRLLKRPNLSAIISSVLPAKSNHKMRRPWMTRITITMIAMTRSMWMSPPMVYEVTNPRSQRINRMIAIVSSTWHPPLLIMDKSIRIGLINNGQTNYRRNANANAFSSWQLKRLTVTSASITTRGTALHTTIEPRTGEMIASNGNFIRYMAVEDTALNRDMD